MEPTREHARHRLQITPEPVTDAGRRRRRALLIWLTVALVTTGVSNAANAANTPDAPNMLDAETNCTLVVPANPLTAAGLSTPFQLRATDPAQGECHEANTEQAAFVQGAILSRAGRITLYDPLVVDEGTQPAAPPAPAVVPAGSTVALWFGFNGDTLSLATAGGTDALAAGQCVGGLNGSPFGQFAACNAPAFFRAAQRAIGSQRLKVPKLGTASDGRPCPTVRDFSVVDQDQSDNVDTDYLVTPDGRIAQNNQAARTALAAVGGGTKLTNGSDNRLLTSAILPALGCSVFTAPNGSQDGAATASLPLQEIQAARYQAKPVALVPLTNPMTLVDGAPSVAKTDLYRANVGQRPVGGGSTSGDGTAYCRGLFASPAGIRRVFRDQAILSTAPSLNAGSSTSLFTFLAGRAGATFDNLGCGQRLNMANPITLQLAGNVVTGATFAARPVAIAPGAPLPNEAA